MPNTRTTDKLYGDKDERFYAVHYNGLPYAIFGGANQAIAYERGMDSDDRRYFHIENADGERVTFRDNPRSPGHAYAILDKLNAGGTDG